MKKHIAFAVSLAAICSPAAAQVRPWSLAECIEWARSHNIEIAQQELSAQDAELAARQARLDYIPSLSAGISSSSTFGSSYDSASQNTRSDYTSMSGSISAGTDLFAGLIKYHTLKRSDLSLKETLLSIDKAKNDLALNVTAAYLEILFAEENLRIVDSQAELLQMQVDRGRKQVEVGTGTLGDLLQIESQLADVKHQRLLADNQRTIAYFNLCQLLEIEDFKNFRIVEPELDGVLTGMSASSVDDVIETAQSLPQIESARLGVQIAERDVSIARSGYYPSLRLSAGYGSGFEFNSTQRVAVVADPDPNNPSHWNTVAYPFGDQVRNRASASVGLTLSIPIFNSLSTRNNVRSKRIALDRADYGLRIAQKQLSREIQQAFIDAEAAFEQHTSAVSNVQTSEESFRVVEQRFNLGASTPVDYSAALYSLMSARSSLLQAKYQFIFKTKILDFYRGIPIDLK